MKPVLVMLPMDDRPVNYDYPAYFARLAGYELHLPPREWLGNPWRESQHLRLVEWLTRESRSADLLVVALDTLAYGGLIPSRTSRDSLESVLEHLSVLANIKADRNDLPIFASSIIMRISRANSCEEEKDYWATYGARMFRLSYLEHKTSLGEASTQEMAERSELFGQITPQVYEDYLAGRQRNHQVNLRMIDWLEQGIFNYLLLPQDDTADYGWNIAEARELQSSIRQKHLTEYAITYPGADEIGCLLLASAVCKQVDFKLKVFPRYSSIHAASVITSYEDRPIHELIKAHLAPLGGTLADTPDEADLVLLLNAPSSTQGEASFQWLARKGLEDLQTELLEYLKPYLQQVGTEPSLKITKHEMDTPERSPEELVRAVQVYQDAEKPVAIADVAFANGSDMHFADLLLRHRIGAHLISYAGWNTAGNTLGTVLAHAALWLLNRKKDPNPEQTQAHYEFLFLRFLDDYFYQSLERSKCMLEDLPALRLQPTMERLPSSMVEEVESRLRGRLIQRASELEMYFVDAGVVKAVQVENIHLPWQRLFEIGFDVHIKLS